MGGEGQRRGRELSTQDLRIPRSTQKEATNHDSKKRKPRFTIHDTIHDPDWKSVTMTRTRWHEHDSKVTIHDHDWFRTQINMPIQADLWGVWGALGKIQFKLVIDRLNYARICRQQRTPSATDQAIPKQLRAVVSWRYC